MDQTKGVPTGEAAKNATTHFRAPEAPFAAPSFWVNSRTWAANWTVGHTFVRSFVVRNRTDRRSPHA